MKTRRTMFIKLADVKKIIDNDLWESKDGKKLSYILSTKLSSIKCEKYKDVKILAKMFLNTWIFEHKLVDSIKDLEFFTNDHDYLYDGYGDDLPDFIFRNEFRIEGKILRNTDSFINFVNRPFYDGSHGAKLFLVYIKETRELYWFDKRDRSYDFIMLLDLKFYDY